MDTLFSLMQDSRVKLTEEEGLTLSKRLLLLFHLSLLQENVCKDIERELKGKGIYRFLIKHNHEKIKRLIKANYEDFFKRFTGRQIDTFCNDADDLQKIINEWAGIKDDIL